MKENLNISDSFSLSRGGFHKDRAAIAGEVYIRINRQKAIRKNTIHTSLMEYMMDCTEIVTSGHIRSGQLFSAENETPGGLEDGNDGIIYRLDSDGLYRTMATTQITPVRSNARRWKGQATIEQPDQSPSPSPSPSPAIVSINRFVIGRTFKDTGLGFSLPFAQLDSLHEVVPGDLVTVEWELYFVNDNSPSP